MGRPRRPGGGPIVRACAPATPDWAPPRRAPGRGFWNGTVGASWEPLGMAERRRPCAAVLHPYGPIRIAVKRRLPLPARSSHLGDEVLLQEGHRSAVPGPRAVAGDPEV